MDEIYYLVFLGIAFLPAIIGVVLILTGIIQVLMAESDDKVLQSVMGVVMGLMGPLVLLAFLLRPLDMLAHSMGRGRRARPGEIGYEEKGRSFIGGRRARPAEIAYEENERRENGPYAGGVRIGIGIVLIIFVYFAREILLYIALGLLFLLAHIFSSR